MVHKGGGGQKSPKNGPYGHGLWMLPNIYVDGNTNSIFYAALVVLYNSVHIPAVCNTRPCFGAASRSQRFCGLYFWTRAPSPKK